MNVLLDFYGTVVEEAHSFLNVVAKEFLDNGAQVGADRIKELWWRGFSMQCDKAYGKNYKQQKRLYGPTFRFMEEQSGAKVDRDKLTEQVIAFSVGVKPFEDSLRFLNECPFPCYILSNIDNEEIQTVLTRRKICVQGVFTSEDAREYKPRKGIFEKGLKHFGLAAEETVYIGDSLRNDYFGARNAGIFSIWINRLNEPVPQGVEAAKDLYSALGLLRKNSDSAE